MSKPTPDTPNKGLLPSYHTPPVSEVVCGIRFDVPHKLLLPHIGLIWEKFRSDYPNVQHASPIATAKGELLLDTVTGLPLPRVWFINESDDQLVQLQLDRFYFNWRRKEKEYPRYTYVIQNFEHIYDTISDFFVESKLGEIDPIECELSYVNHLYKGAEWNTIEDLPKIFMDFIWNNSDNRFLPHPSKLSWQTEFPMEEKMGRLIVSLKQAIRTSDKEPLFILELKAIGLGPSNSKQDIIKWFDVAHKWIVKGFTDLTTPELHKFWEREE
jgi:uncharacterized protein (TIGR04255 family)